jgi:hypothetical protein
MDKMSGNTLSGILVILRALMAARQGLHGRLLNMPPDRSDRASVREPSKLG